MMVGSHIEIEGYATVWGVLCNRSSVIAEGAFRSLIASGTWAPQMLWHHEPGNVAGRWTAFKEDDRGLFVRGVVDLALPYGRVAFNRVSTGEATGLSPKDASLHRPVSPTVVQIDRVLSCREISIVTRPGCALAIDVQDDGASIGTVSISTGGAFTFTTTSGTSKTVAAGSRLEFIAPSSADATAADIAFTLEGTL